MRCVSIVDVCESWQRAIKKYNLMLYISVLSVQLHLPVKTYKDSALKFINHARKQRVREISR